MLNNHRPVLGFLYVLLFVSFVAMSLAQAVGAWISTTYGGWVTVEAVAAYGAYLGGLIWLIRWISKAVGIEVAPAPSTPVMSEMEFIRSQMNATDASDVRPVELPPENGNGQKLKV